MLLHFRSCRVGCLDENLVKGKIVLCGFFEGIAEAYKAGALGAVVLNTQLDDVPFVVPLPASAVTLSDMFMLEDYVNLTKFGFLQALILLINSAFVFLFCVE